jgi:hypothetical protein
MTKPFGRAPRHPLVAARDAAYNQPEQHSGWSLVADLYAHHDEHGQSDQGVYYFRDGWIDNPHPTWEYLGPIEDYGHRAANDPLCVTVIYSGDRGARMVYTFDQLYPGARGARARLHVAVKEAERLAGPLEIVLGLLIASGQIQTRYVGETVRQATNRVAHDVMWALVRRMPERFSPDMARPDRLLVDSPDGLWALALDELDIVVRPAAVYARTLLDARDEVAAGLAVHDVEWGGDLLTAREVAQRLHIQESTWRAYVARGQAPVADRPVRWREVTVTAHQLAALGQGARTDLR